VKLTTQFHLVPRSRVSGAKPLLRPFARMTLTSSLPLTSSVTSSLLPSHSTRAHRQSKRARRNGGGDKSDLSDKIRIPYNRDPVHFICASLFIWSDNKCRGYAVTVWTLLNDLLVQRRGPTFCVVSDSFVPQFKDATNQSQHNIAAPFVAKCGEIFFFRCSKRT
jgi:hypothetical protein